MVAELFFRIIVISVILIIWIFCGLKWLVLPSEIADQAIVGMVMSAVLFLLVGPYWPSEKNLKIENSLLYRYPRLRSFIGYLLLTISGFFMTWAIFTHPMQWHGRSWFIYKLVGQLGLASIFFVFGFIGLVGCAYALNKKP
jgi:hypothetical protein